jgi:hypothetical protein
MIYTQFNRPAPSDIPAFVSVMAGVATVHLTYSHRIVPLLIANVAWLGYLALLRWRASTAAGKWLDMHANSVFPVAIAFWSVGLLLSAVYVVVYRSY